MSSIEMNATTIANFVVKLEKENTELRAKIEALEEENADLHIQIAESDLKSDADTESETDTESEYESESDSESDFFTSHNYELVDVFDKLASYEEDSHKRDAYRKAADAIYKLPFKVNNGSELATGPMKVAGIGKGISKKIDEFLSTGKVQRLEKLDTSTNKDIARALKNLASREAKNNDSNPHKIHSYELAAKIIRGLDFEVLSGEEIAKGPNKIKGIGMGIANKIDEFLQTGEIQ